MKRMRARTKQHETVKQNTLASVLSQQTNLDQKVREIQKIYIKRQKHIKLNEKNTSFSLSRGLRRSESFFFFFFCLLDVR
jgi:predicted transposase YbfD/YdcC